MPTEQLTDNSYGESTWMDWNIQRPGVVGNVDPGPHFHGIYKIIWSQLVFRYQISDLSKPLFYKRFANSPLNSSHSKSCDEINSSCSIWSWKYYITVEWDKLISIGVSGLKLPTIERITQSVTICLPVFVGVSTPWPHFLLAGRHGWLHKNIGVSVDLIQ